MIGLGSHSVPEPGVGRDPVEIEHLQEAAKKRGTSRTKLVQVVMEELVLEILDDDDQVRNEPRQ